MGHMPEKKKKKRRLRVLFVVNAKEDTGIFVFARALARELGKKGVSVSIDRLKGKYDLIHFQNPLPTSFAKVKCMYPLVPVVCTTNMTHDELQGIFPRKLMPLAENYLYLFYLTCKKVICSSPKIIKELGKLPFIKEKTVYMPNGVDIMEFRRNRKEGDAFRKKWGIGKDRKVVLSVATVQKRKGIFDFMEAAKELKEYSFLWVGNLPDLPTLESKRELEKIFRGKHDNVIFTGFLEKRKKLNSVYSAADLFLFPTYAETFGLVAVEAASFGLPVLMRDLPEFRMFPFGMRFRNNKEMKRLIRKLLDEPAAAKKESKKSLEGTKEFSMPHYADEIKKMYQDIL
jgi:1,2-diacylglycerol-3-alpha-glucose alpha-1,2-galactosyltransferase